MPPVASRTRPPFHLTLPRCVAAPPAYPASRAHRARWWRQYGRSAGDLPPRLRRALDRADWIEVAVILRLLHQSAWVLGWTELEELCELATEALAEGARRSAAQASAAVERVLACLHGSSPCCAPAPGYAAPV